MPWKQEMKYEIEKAKVKLKGLKDSVHKSISVMEKKRNYVEGNEDYFMQVE